MECDKEEEGRGVCDVVFIGKGRVGGGRGGVGRVETW